MPPKIGGKTSIDISKKKLDEKKMEKICQSIEEFIEPISKRKSKTLEKMNELLPKAIKVKMCGWFLFNTIHQYKNKLRVIEKRKCPI